jgi:hypothetical protein
MKMKRSALIVFLLALASGISAQLRMRDIFAQLPDSVLPLTTRNNRLDCIDFIENGMEARVKNLFGDQVVLDSLTEDFMVLRTSEASCVEMKLFAEGTDTLICVNRIYMGPVADSEVKVFDTSWSFVRTVPRPDVAQFVRSVGDIQPWTEEMADTMRMVRAEAEFLPLMRATLRSASPGIVWTLQTSEFSKDIKKVAEKYLQPVKDEL